MAYQFTKDLETGNAAIDMQHKQLIQALNNLLDACSKGAGRDQLNATAKFLLDYTSKHFADEEKLQLQNKYPDYQRHKQLHEGFKRTVRELINELNAQGPTVAMVGKLNATLSSWLINHIKREDKKIAEHIRSQSK